MQVTDRADGLSRRGFLGLCGTGVCAGLMGASLHQALFAREALAAAPQDALYDACLSIFFPGGPSQTDTWDPKPGSRSSYPGFQTIDLGVSDVYGRPVRIGGRFNRAAEVFPDLANLVMNDPKVKLGIIRSMWHGSAEHGNGQRYMNSWWRSEALVRQYPSVASAMAYYFRDSGFGIPSVVIAGDNGSRVNDRGQSRCPTALQVQASSAENNPTVAALRRPPGVDPVRYARRKALLDRLNQAYLAKHPDDVARDLEKATEDAARITMTGRAAGAFDLRGKPLLPAAEAVTSQRLTLAQELIKAGVPYVQVGIGGSVRATPQDPNGIQNDSHGRNMEVISRNWGVSVNEGVTRLARNLAASGKRVLITMYGDFGRTPASVDGGRRDGRDHWNDGFSVAFLSINQPKFKMTAIGDTGPGGLNRSGSGLKDPIAPGDLGAFVFRALGIQAGRSEFDLTVGGRPVSPVERVNKSDLLMKTFGLA